MLIEALLIVLIILVLAGIGLHMSGYLAHCWNTSAAKPAAESFGVSTVKPRPRVLPGELAALQENREYFTSVAGEGSGAVHGTENFGTPGATYGDMLTLIGVDQQAVKNHAEFVKDRMANNNQNVLGKTYSPDSHDSYDPIPWVGIRGRPQAAPTSNPTQVPDVDYDLYSNKPAITWRSS